MTNITKEISLFRSHLIAILEESNDWVPTSFFISATGQQGARIADAMEELINLGVVEKKYGMFVTDGKKRRMNCYRKLMHLTYR